MAQQDKNIISQQLVHSYVFSVISICLLLFIIGMTSLLVINAKAVSDYFKERLGVAVVLRADVKDADSTLLVKRLMALPYSTDAVRNAVYISREQGAAEMKEMLGDDFMEVFDDNPLPASIELQLHAPYVQNDSIALLEKQLADLSFVQEVSYQAPVVTMINRNVERIGTGLAIVIVLLLIISFVLIHNTIQLSVYSRRFTIYTMRLVGATRSYIRRPFMAQASWQGIIAALLANLLLTAVLFGLQKQFPEILVWVEPRLFLAVMVIVVFCGVVLCRISTFFVVNKVVRLDTSSLYY